KEEALKGLHSASKFIRKTLGKRVRLKYIPTIIFMYDDSLEYGSKIDKILEDLKENENDSTYRVL
ncbi:MAG: 30S ribosome-binding factor RbfA, partial [Thermodesulfobacteriota bacterium]|nr:30S ribosome-binding factor RbfA [Thermodesulfobacteriota bacterium]